MPALEAYVGLAEDGEKALCDAFRTVADGHRDEQDVHHGCLLMAGLSQQHRRRLAPLAQRYARGRTGRHRLGGAHQASGRAGAAGLLHDLQDLYVLATLVQTTWSVVAQGARVRDDPELLDVAVSSVEETRRQLAWVGGRLRQAAPEPRG